MAESLRETRRSSHTLFDKGDFTFDEIRRGNILAEAVLKMNRPVCKICGATDEAVYTRYCGEKKR